MPRGYQFGQHGLRTFPWLHKILLDRAVIDNKLRLRLNWVTSRGNKRRINRIKIWRLIKYISLWVWFGNDSKLCSIFNIFSLSTFGTYPINKQKHSMKLKCLMSKTEVFGSYYLLSSSWSCEKVLLGTGIQKKKHESRAAIWGTLCQSLILVANERKHSHCLKQKWN